MKLHEFLITVIFAVLLMGWLLAWAATHDRLCIKPDGQPLRCVAWAVK